MQRERKEGVAASLPTSEEFVGELSTVSWRIGAVPVKYVLN